jgi:hypothetical protein
VLPFGRGKAFASHGVLSYVIGNFKTSGVYTYASGRPFTVNSGGARANALDAFGAVAATPNLIGTPQIVGNVDCWFFASNNKIGTTSPCLNLAPGLTNAYQLQAPGFWATSAETRCAGRIPTCLTLR